MESVSVLTDDVDEEKRSGVLQHFCIVHLNTKKQQPARLAITLFLVKPPGILKWKSYQYLMIASSVFTGLIGLATTFFPKEILHAIGLAISVMPVLFVQITGASYLGFDIMNWMAKSVLIGGIYARPLCMGNFLHFMVVAIALLKAAINHSDLHYLGIAAVLY